MSTLRIAGMTDEQTTCDACGRVELRGTVIVVDEDNNEIGRYGTTCGSRIVGSKTTAQQARSTEMHRRHDVVTHLQRVRREIKAGNLDIASWYLRDFDQNFVLVWRDDEHRAIAKLRAEIEAAR